MSAHAGCGNPATIEEPYRKATLLSHALRGLLDTMDTSMPVISWQEELRPLYGLALQVNVLTRDLYLQTDEAAAQQAAESAKERTAILEAAIGKRTGSQRVCHLGPEVRAVCPFAPQAVGAEKATGNPRGGWPSARGEQLGRSGKIPAPEDPPVKGPPVASHFSKPAARSDSVDRYYHV